jgi:hypothetical protein
MSLEYLLRKASIALSNQRYVEAEQLVLQVIKKSAMPEKIRIFEVANGIANRIYAESNNPQGLKALGEFLLGLPLGCQVGAYTDIHMAHFMQGEYEDALNALQKLEQFEGCDKTNYRFIATYILMGNESLAAERAKEFYGERNLGDLIAKNGLQYALTQLDFVLSACAAENKIGFARKMLEQTMKSLIELSHKQSYPVLMAITPEKFGKKSPEWASNTDTITDCPKGYDPYLHKAIGRICTLHQERESILYAAEKYHQQPAEKKTVFISNDGLYYNKVGDRQSIQKEVSVLDYYVNTAFAKSADNVFPLPMKYNANIFGFWDKDHPCIFNALNAGIPLEDVLEGFIAKGKFRVKLPIVMFKTANNSITVYYGQWGGEMQGDAKTTELILRESTINLAKAHALCPEHLAEPAHDAEGCLKHAEQRMANAGVSAEEREIVLAGIKPIAKKLEYAYKTFVKDANPGNVGVTLNPKIFEGQLGCKREINLPLFDFGTVRVASPFYDLIKLLEHDNYLPGEKVDALTEEYRQEYNRMLDYARSVGIHKQPIDDAERFAFERENYRIIQYIASQFHPKYATDRYWKNKAFRMGRGAETADILCTKYSDKYRKEELEAISQLKQVFEKYRRIAEAQVKK